jgi:hypothetical protein
LPDVLRNEIIDAQARRPQSSCSVCHSTNQLASGARMPSSLIIASASMSLSVLI